MNMTHVAGKNVGNVKLYALSTCPWCKKTKQLLADLGVEYDYIDVDLLNESEKTEVVEAIKKWNPARSYPTIVLNEEKCIVGFREDDIRKAVTK